MNIDQCAERLGTSVRHVRGLVLGHDIPHIKVGGKLRFDPKKVDRWLEAHTVV